MSRPATPVAAAARQAVLDRIAGRERLTGEYRLILSETAASAVTQAQDALLAAEENGADADTVDAARTRLTAAHADLEADTVVLRFEGLPAAVYRALIDEHPPTEAQQADAAKRGERLRWNPDTFPDALIAATCTDPGFDSVEQVAALLSSSTARVSENELAQIALTARLTCEGAREVSDWGKDFGGTAT